MLQKGHASDGRQGHSNVANWAKRRLGKGGLFADEVGALAVPVNELLRDYMGRQQEKHWWLALLVNPRGACPKDGPVTEHVSVSCLDSFARTGMRYKPPRRALKMEKETRNEAYFVEVSSFSRSGFVALINFRAQGDGSLGPLLDPRLSRLEFGHRVIKEPELDLKVRNYGDHGVPGVLEGTLEFAFDSSTRSRARICGEYTLHYAGVAEYKRLGEVLWIVQQMVEGGYCGKECEIHAPADGQPYADEKVAAGLQLPDTPQQESAHDCGFFILEQVLRLLQLTPTALRSLASKSTEEIASLPWPAQREVVKRKKKLREVTADLFVASRRQNTSDVEAGSAAECPKSPGGGRKKGVLLKNDEILRKKLLLAMWEGPYFARAVANVIGMDPGPLPEIPTLPKEEERQAKEEESEESSSERSSSRARSSSPLGRSARESSSSSRGKKRKTRRSASRASEPKRRRHHEGHGHASRPHVARPPPAPSFTKDDLQGEQGYPSKTLRNMCVQYKVLPIGMVERTDLLKALEPLAVVKSASSSCATARAVERHDVDRIGWEDANRSQRTSETRAEDPGFGFGSRWDRDSPRSGASGHFLTLRNQRLPELYGPGNGVRSDLPSFTTADLDTMPISKLKMYCIQFGRLPSGSLEKSDLKKALLPLAKVAPKPVTPAVVKKVLPSFTLEELQTMPISKLKNICLQYGRMPHGPVERTDLVSLLKPFATVHVRVAFGSPKN
ncbi:ULP_PROTEASE domain-containing protein [Durusdinium trenchii]|uniref:ULP_PROTEASE domain-containing protein n=1 Tax=Durusdinium trenchii TaxID=1381693 RepID=A0ABP0QZN5_9DINO